MKLKQAIELAAVATRNMILGGNLASLTMARHPMNMVLYVAEALFLYKAMAGRRGVPQKNVFEVLPTSDVEDITLGSLTSGTTWMFAQASYTADLINLCLICRLIKPKVVFEIGTFRGNSAHHFALNTPDDARVYTLDLPKEESVQSKLHTNVADDMRIKSRSTIVQKYVFERSPVASKITCLTGDSASFDYSPYFGKVDFFFVDGAHSYEYVRSDTLNAMKCCHPGSVIAWHDFARMGLNQISKWILEFARDHEVYSIPGGSLAFMVVK